MAFDLGKKKASSSWSNNITTHELGVGSISVKMYDTNSKTKSGNKERLRYTRIREHFDRGFCIQDEDTRACRTWIGDGHRNRKRIHAI